MSTGSSQVGAVLSPPCLYISYLRQTKMNIDSQMKEHIINIKLHQIDKSAIATHVCEKPHRTGEAKLLEHVQNFSELAIWENFFIQKNKFIATNFDI